MRFLEKKNYFYHQSFLRKRNAKRDYKINQNTKYTKCNNVPCSIGGLKIASIILKKMLYIQMKGFKKIFKN